MAGYDAPPLTKPGWMADAACREHRELRWIPPYANRYEIARAKHICAACLVRRECLAYALEFDPVDLEGVWGGSTQRERRQLRQNRPSQGP